MYTSNKYIHEYHIKNMFEERTIENLQQITVPSIHQNKECLPFIDTKSFSSIRYNPPRLGRANLNCPSPCSRILSSGGSRNKNKNNKKNKNRLLKNLKKISIISAIILD